LASLGIFVVLVAVPILLDMQENVGTGILERERIIFFFFVVKVMIKLGGKSSITG
jgi:hypothetical protein